MHQDVKVMLASLGEKSLPVAKKNFYQAPSELETRRMCNQAFYALKRFLKGRKMSPEILFLLRQMSRMVFWNYSFAILMMTIKRGWKRLGDGTTLHKSYKHCRYDLINISQCRTMLTENNTENFHFVLDNVSLSSLKKKTFYCIK